MVRALSVVVAVVLAVVAVAVPAMAALVLFPGLWLPSLIEARLGSRLDRDVVVAGPASLDLWGGPPAVVVEDLRIANPPWADEPWFLRAERARVELRWAALQRFSIDPTLLALQAPRVYLVRARSGGTTWPRLDGGGAGGGGGLDLNRLRITDGRALYEDQERNTRLEATVETRDGRLAVRAEGRWRGQPMTASAVGGAPTKALRAGDGYPLRLEVISGALDLIADGTVVGLPGLRGVDVRLSGRGPSLAEVGRLVGVAFPSSPPFDLSGRLRGQWQTWSYGDASGTIGESDVAGRVEVRGGSVPHVELDLTSDHVRVGDALAVAGLGGGMPPGAAAGGGRVIPDVPLPSGLPAITLRLKLRAREAVGGPVPLGALTVHASITEGRLTVEPVEASLPDGGELAGRFALDTTLSRPRAALRATFQNVAFTVPLPEKGEGARGTVSGRVDLSGAGDSLRGVLAGAQGEAALLVPNGRLSSAVLGQTGVGLSDLLGLFVPADDGGGRTVALHCAAASATVTDGIARVPGLVLDTDTARLEGRGSLDLAAETMDMVVRIDPADPQLLSFSGPVHVTGPWTSPTIDPEVGETLLRGLAGIGLGLAAGPLAALVPLVDLGQAEDRGCGGVLRGAPSTSQVP